LSFRLAPWDAVLAAKLLKKLSHRAGASVGYIIQTLTDSFVFISARGDIE